MKLLWKYFIPILLFVTGITTLTQSPDEPVSRGIPIIPGNHQTEIAMAFMACGVIVGICVYLYEKKKKDGSA